MSEQTPWQDLPSLLHDARLRHLEWDPALATVSLLFDCLRRELDGTALPESDVTIGLEGVAAIVVGYESGVEGVRPSEYQLGRFTMALHTE